MVSLKRLDAFTKTRSDLQQKSVVGGIITLVATTTAALLFVGQIVLYFRGDTRHSLSLSKSISIPLLPISNHNNEHQRALSDSLGRIRLHIHVTFPHLSCDRIDITHDGASMESGELEKVHGPHTLLKRKPTSSELRKIDGSGRSFQSSKGCTIIGELRPYIVAGSFSIGMDMRTWTEATTALSLGYSHSLGKLSKMTTDGASQFLEQFNISHYIHTIQFGRAFPRATEKPLEELPHIIENDFFGVAVAQMQVKLIPTTMKKISNQNVKFVQMMYQTSVVDVTIQPHTIVTQGSQSLPGLTVSYDFTPLMVHHDDGRDSILIFLSSLISIVGGVFVTVGLLTSCLVHSAQVVSKKID